MTSRIAFGLLLILLAGRPVSAADPPVKALEAQIQKVIEDSSPSVVSVVVSHSKNYPTKAPKTKPWELGGYEPLRVPDVPGFGRRFRGEQPVLDRLDLSLVENVADHLFGSGVVLDADQGLILTAHHLTEGAQKVYVRGAGGKGSYANIVASDAKSDLAVLRLISAVNDLKAVQFADVRWVDEPKGRKANLKAGSAVVALGHPLAAGAGDGVPSASWGIISKFNTRSAAPPVLAESTTPRPLHTYGGLFQVDARVTLGSSGAGVFNLDGQLVGLGSAVAAVYGSEASGGYAIPMDANYRRIIDVLRSGREVEYGFLGVSPQTDEGGSGVRISTLSPSCPAAAAGLMQFDVVTAIDGHPLRTTDDLLHFVGAALAGNEVTVEYHRGGRPATTRVKLAKNPNALPFIASVPPSAHFGLQVEYQSVKFAGPVVGFRNQPTPNPPPGVVVRELVAGSAAAKKFDELGAVRSWWVITHVDGKPVTTPNEYDAAVKGKTTVKLVLADASDPAIRQTVTLP